MGALPHVCRDENRELFEDIGGARVRAIVARDIVRRIMTITLLQPSIGMTIMVGTHTSSRIQLTHSLKPPGCNP
jgi:hypothetical protein